MQRHDAAIARLAVATATRYRDPKMENFMPWPIEEEQVASPESILAYLTASVKKKN